MFMNTTKQQLIVGMRMVNNDNDSKAYWNS